MFAFGRNVDRKGFLGPLHFRLFHPLFPIEGPSQERVRGREEMAYYSSGSSQGEGGGRDKETDVGRSFVGRLTVATFLGKQGRYSPIGFSSLKTKYNLKVKNVFSP